MAQSYAALPHLRPLGVGEIVDGAFTLYRRHFHAFFTTALLPQLPLVAIWLLFMPIAAALGDDETTAVVFLVFTILAWPAAIYAGVMPMASLTRMAADAYLGNPVSRDEGKRWGKRAFWSVLAAQLLLGICFALGLLLLVVPGLIVLAAFFALTPAVVLEQKDPIQAIDRSRALSQGAWLPILGAMLLLWIIQFLPTMGIQGVLLLTVDAVSSATTEGFVWRAALNVIGSCIGALAVPLTVTGTTLLYYDRRVRVEGFGLDPDGSPPPVGALTVPAG